MYPLDQSSSQAFPYGFHSSQQLPPTLLNGIPNGTENPFSGNPLNATGTHRHPTLQMPLIGGLMDPMTQVNYKIKFNALYHHKKGGPLSYMYDIF